MADGNRITVEVTKAEHDATKAKAAADGWSSMSDLVRALLAAWRRGEIKIKPPPAKGRGE